jgi:hypothetical protein
MRHIEGFDAEFGWSAGDEPACEAVTPAIDGGAAPHAEDTFLQDFVAFAGGRNHAEHAALELARAALDAIEDVDGAWQSLTVAAWLGAAARAAPAIEDAELCMLARAFVDWLVDRGRLSLHGARVLTRRIVSLARAATAEAAVRAIAA